MPYWDRRFPALCAGGWCREGKVDPLPGTVYPRDLDLHPVSNADESARSAAPDLPSGGIEIVTVILKQVAGDETAHAQFLDIHEEAVGDYFRDEGGAGLCFALPQLIPEVGT